MKGIDRTEYGEGNKWVRGYIREVRTVTFGMRRWSGVRSFSENGLSGSFGIRVGILVGVLR